MPRTIGVSVIWIYFGTSAKNFKEIFTENENPTVKLIFIISVIVSLCILVYISYFTR